MTPKISVVINTFNEEANIEQAIKSIKNLADEVVVCDMYSADKTVELAKKLGAKVVFHKLTHFVEPARNFAVSKTSGDWILVLDADEEIGEALGKKLIEISQSNQIDFVAVPRQNIIFGKWIKSAMWWPDRHIRFYKKGQVVWGEKIHSKPEVKGEGLELEASEELSIIHHHYTSVGQFVERMNRYTTIQSKQHHEEGYRFNYQDIVQKPLGEFLSRYFAQKGFEDGLHGLALSMLQALSHLVLYLKVWELEKFDQKQIDLQEIRQLSDQSGKEVRYWLLQTKLSSNPIKSFWQKTRHKIS